jgi:hypothetical protein
MFRVVALVAAGALSLHELRYLVGHGEQAGQVEAAQGHGYLAVCGPLVVALLTLAGAHFVALLLRARARGTPPLKRREPRLTSVWLAASSALLLVHSGQELFEGALAAGHPDGLEAIAGHGGWAVLLLALVLGALIALALRGTDAAIAAAGRPAKRRLPRPPGRDRIQLSPAHRPAQGALARKLAGRAPPRTT